MKEKRQNRWRKLDNAAQAFPAATGKKDSRVFRFYCVLKEKVDGDRLQGALDLTLEKYPLFRSVLRKGLFWFYMEPRALPALVKPEDRPPCGRIYVPDQKKLLFEVSYYKNRINLEVFHGLTDGTGAMQFLKELVRNYLVLTYPEQEFPETDGGEILTDSDYEEDSFSQYYTGKKRSNKRSRKAFQLKGDRLEQAEMFLIMSVEPGFGGQAFIPESLERIRTLRDMLEEKGIEKDIEVDGGIYHSNVAEVLKAGANVIVSGSGVYKGDIRENTTGFMEILKAYE